MKVGRYIFFIIIGGIIGGLIGSNIERVGTFIASTNFSGSRLNLIICVSTSLLILALMLYQWYVQQRSLKYKYMISNVDDGSDIDHYEKQATLDYNKVHIIAHLQLAIGFIAIFFIALGNAAPNEFFYALIPYLLTLIPSLMLGFYSRRFDALLPKIAEKHYTGKALALLDEGERHIVLISMYKNYQVNLVLLIMAIVFIGIFSIYTGLNQTPGLLALIVIFIYNSLGYLIKLRQFYKA